MDLVRAHQVFWSAKLLDLGFQLVSEIDGRPNPEACVGQLCEYGAGWIRKAIEIDVGSISDPNVVVNLSDIAFNHRSPAIAGLVRVSA